MIDVYARTERNGTDGKGRENDSTWKNFFRTTDRHFRGDRYTRGTYPSTIVVAGDGSDSRDQLYRCRGWNSAHIPELYTHRSH